MYLTHNIPQISNKRGTTSQNLYNYLLACMTCWCTPGQKMTGSNSAQLGLLANVTSAYGSADYEEDAGAMFTM